MRSKSEYLSYGVPRHVTFFDIVTVKFYSFLTCGKKNFRFVRVLLFKNAVPVRCQSSNESKCVKNRVQ